jgi:uncharacterized repeat protein (TIGR01451 family)
MAATLSLGATAHAAVVFDGAPATGPPPVLLGPYPTTAFPDDTRPAYEQSGDPQWVSGIPGPGGGITFDREMLHCEARPAESCEADLSASGYANGDLYATVDSAGIARSETTIALPADTGAFYLYALPDAFNGTITATTQDGTSSGPLPVPAMEPPAPAGARYFGFYATGSDQLASITVSTDGFALVIGRFGWASKGNPDLSISQTDTPDPVRADRQDGTEGNDRLTYELTATNHGPGAAHNVKVVDRLPTVSAVISATAAPQGTCAIAPPTTPPTPAVTCDIGDLADGEHVAVTIVATIADPGIVENVAGVSSAGTDSDPSNDESHETTTVKGIRIATQRSTYWITAVPEMPAVSVAIEGVGFAPGELDTVTFDWTYRSHWEHDCVYGNHAHTWRSAADPLVRTGTQAFNLDFEGKLRGGTLALTARTTVAGDTYKVKRDLTIGGRNPTPQAIQGQLSNFTLQRIAARESGGPLNPAGTQFNQDGTPHLSERCDGPGHGIGIMQLTPTANDGQIWDWTKNIQGGSRVFEDKIPFARGFPNRVETGVRASDQSLAEHQRFVQLRDAYNQDRVDRGLRPLEISVPSFTQGDWNCDLQQLELDTIRQYNGGHLYKIATQTSAAGERLIVTNINARDRRGTAAWAPRSMAEQAPAPDRQYVTNVLDESAPLGICRGSTYQDGP